MGLVCPKCGADIGDVEEGKITCPNCEEELYVIDGEAYPIYVECPECGATMEVDFDLMEAVCPECNARFEVELLGDGDIELIKDEEEICTDDTSDDDELY
jgi:DNA-directed RNA polymerase subunit RPC12/RpoP